MESRTRSVTSTHWPHPPRGGRDQRRPHTLYLILEAADPPDVDQFMSPLQQLGSVEVLPASHCEEVVKRAAC